MANHKSGSERYNDKMAKIFENAKHLERERLKRGEMPNPGLTSQEDARKYGWEITGAWPAKVTRIASLESSCAGCGRTPQTCTCGEDWHDRVTRVCPELGGTK
jgi:hypothetical protein